MKTCAIDECNRPSEKRGLCGAHYQRLRKYGDPLISRKRPNGSGSVYIDAEGYFRVQFGKTSNKLHRMIVEAVIGRPLLSSEIVHHKDHNKLNNNPENLEIMTRSAHVVEHHKNVPDGGKNSQTERYCKRCDSTKPVSEFYPDKKESFGRRHTCIACCKEKYNSARSNRRHTPGASPVF